MRMMMTARHRVLWTATSLLWLVGLLLLAAAAVKGTTTTTASSPSSSVVAVSAAAVSVVVVDPAADPVVMFTSSSSSSSSSKRRRMMKMTIKTLSSTSSSTTTTAAAAASSSSSASSSPLTTNSDNDETSTTTTKTYTTTMNEIMVMFRKSLARRQRRWTASRRRRRRAAASDAASAVSAPVVGLVVPRGGGGGGGLDGDGDDLQQEDFGNNNKNVSSLDTDDQEEENESSSSSKASAAAAAAASNSRASSSSSSIFDLWGSSSASSSSAANGLSATASALVERWTREKLQFLDRIALIASSMLKREQDAHLETTAKKKKTKKKKHRKSRHSSLGQSLIGQMLRRSSSTSSAEEDVDTTTSSGEEDEEYDEEDDDLNAITLQSDLTLPGRHFYVVTTAALPWFTGTAVNPLLRAAHLHRRTLQINSQNSHHSHQHQEQNQHSNVIVNDTICNSTATSTTLFTNKINNIDDLQSLNEKQQQHANQTTPGDDSDEKHHHHHPHHHHRWVTLVIPWLELPQDQQVLYGQVFVNEQAQEDYIRDWLRNNADMADAACPDTGLQILFYPARYHSSLRSIFAMGDIIDNIRAMHIITEEDAADASKSNMLDVAILEEPEHCNWFRAPGDGWTKRFHYVIGIVHTNYKEYASSQYSGLWTAPAIQMMSAAMVRAYCHKVIKLSDALQTYAPEKECTSNVHGVRAEFLQQGLSLAQQQQQQQQDEKSNTATVTLASSSTSQPTAAVEGNTAYFIGKLLWAKGLDLMLDLEDYYRQCTGKYFAIDI